MLPTWVGADLVEAWGSGPFKKGHGNVWAPEEVYFPTILAILGYLRDDMDDEVVRKSVTFSEISRNGDAHPNSFQRLTAEVVMRMKASNAIFGRKFSEGSCSLSTWLQVTEQPSFSKEQKEEMLESDIRRSVDTIDVVGEVLVSRETLGEDEAFAVQRKRQRYLDKVMTHDT